MNQSLRKGRLFYFTCTCWQIFIDHDSMNSDPQSRSGMSYMNSVPRVQHNFLSTPWPNCLDFHTCKMGITLIPFTEDSVIILITWRGIDFIL